MAGQTIKGHIRGDTRIINVQVYEQDKVTPFNLTGCDMFFTLNADNDPTTDSTASIELDSTNNPDQVVFTAPIIGIARIKLINSNTQNLEPGTYYYDVQVIDTFGNVISMPQSKFTVVADISRRTM